MGSVAFIGYSMIIINKINKLFSLSDVDDIYLDSYPLTAGVFYWGKFILILKIYNNDETSDENTQ
ncbi:hypothetical protein I5E97_04550 [Proteus hauseri]|nr:hypothetical protein [Proteus hauseri]MBG6030319.1 hypothetical protein [Proteus hauseri]